MTLSEISQLRLLNQHISHVRFHSADTLLQWVGAMQAQDYEMAKWAAGLRIPGSTRKTIEMAIADGTVIRTHVLRPTWHFVAAKDLRWILQLTSPQIKTSIRSRQNQLGLTKDVIKKSNHIIEKALMREKQMTRRELVSELDNAGLKNNNNRAAHLLLCAELEGIICSGPSRGKDYTYALFEERVPPGNQLNRDEALAKLAGTYFTSHGPASLEDFIWWSGLTRTGAKKALGFVKQDLISEEIDSQTVWFSNSAEIPETGKTSVYLLPAYDEFLISYRDRRASIRKNDQKKAISNNGIFRPLIVVNGEVAGIWKRAIKKGTVYVESSFFTNPSKKIITQVEQSAWNFADFLGKDLKITHIIAQ